VLKVSTGDAADVDAGDNDVEEREQSASSFRRLRSQLRADAISVIARASA
jgi:hypothetical protein